MKRRGFLGSMLGLPAAAVAMTKTDLPQMKAPTKETLVTGTDDLYGEVCTSVTCDSVFSDGDDDTWPEGEWEDE